jgi:hypothetical protein
MQLIALRYYKKTFTLNNYFVSRKFFRFKSFFREFFYNEKKYSMICDSKIRNFMDRRILFSTLFYKGFMKIGGGVFRDSPG